MGFFTDNVLLIASAASVEIYSPNGNCQHKIQAFPAGYFVNLCKKHFLSSTFLNFIDRFWGLQNGITYLLTSI